MKQTSRPAAIFFLLAFLSLQGITGDAWPDDKSSVWEKYANQKYSDLNVSLDGSLAPVFSALGDVGQLHEYFDEDSNPEKYKAYTHFLVQTFADAEQGDVLEAMFANVLLVSTPPKIVLAAIAPHIGVDGKLEGILGGQHSDIAKHIQRQPQQGHLGPPSFIEYVRYLKGSKHKGFEHNVNFEAIVDHMMRTDPQEGFMSMLWADYGFNPYQRANAYLFCGDDAVTVRELQLASSELADYLARIRYSFPAREGQAANIRANLLRLADHEKWWVRLHVACLITKEPELRQPDLVKKLSNDSHERVRAAMEDLDQG